MVFLNLLVRADCKEKSHGASGASAAFPLTIYVVTLGDLTEDAIKKYI